MHTVYLGAGSNLGDRQANILHALQRLRAKGRIEAVSAYYETPAAENVEGPAFLNAALRFETDLEPVALERFLRDVEAAVGRRAASALAARPIDLDILLIDGLVEDFGDFAVPHPRLAERPFYLVPLAEIAPGVREPRSGATVESLAAASDTRGIVRKERGLHFAADRQDQAPEVPLAIDRAGTAHVRRAVRLEIDGRETALSGEFSMVADLAPDKSGVHMSRFAELLEGAMLDVLARDDRPARIEAVCARIAREIVQGHRALRAEVRLRAEFALERWTPVSGKRGEETYTLVGIAQAGRDGVRSAVGVEAEGMTACPCAQGMMREHGVRELREAGFTLEDANRALDALPVATHNQRGRGALLIGAVDRENDIRAEDLVEIVENAMSSETYDLLKRPDEFFIVNKAHRNPKFVEDVVRGILRGALDMYSDFADDTFVQVSQVNYESIHKHDAFAEAFGTFGELRAELRGLRHPLGRTDLAAWLTSRPTPGAG